ncbi:MAG: hypothetical protein IIY04_01050 [Oscillospiraceae bacterium]|nr:hypothetical protein [Oscillospiraceae bacterium]
MQTKTFFVTLGVGLAAGALGAMMLPKDSEVYKTAKNAADGIKTEAEKLMDSMKLMH